MALFAYIPAVYPLPVGPSAASSHYAIYSTNVTHSETYRVGSGQNIATTTGISYRSDEYSGDYESFSGHNTTRRETHEAGAETRYSPGQQGYTVSRYHVYFTNHLTNESYFNPPGGAMWTVSKVSQTYGTAYGTESRVSILGTITYSSVSTYYDTLYSESIEESTGFVGGGDETHTYIASALSSFTVDIGGGVSTTRTIRTTVEDTVVVPWGMQVSYSTELFANHTNEALGLHLYLTPGQLVLDLVGGGVSTTDYFLLGSPTFLTAAEDVVTALLFDRSESVTTVNRVLQIGSAEYDTFLDAADTTYAVTLGTAPPYITTSSTTRWVPSVGVETWPGQFLVLTGYDAPEYSLSEDYSETLTAPVGAVTPYTVKYYNTTPHTLWKAVAQEPGVRSLRRVGHVESTTILETVAPYLFTEDTSYSEQFISTFSSSAIGFAVTSSGRTTATTVSSVSSAGLTETLFQWTFLSPGYFDGGGAGGTPVIVRREALGGIQIPDGLRTDSPRYGAPNLQQIPTQYGIAQRPAVLAPLFSDTDATSATGGPQVTETAYSWRGNHVAANDRPCSWNATAIIPHGVFMTAAYDSSSGTGATALQTTYLPHTEHTTRELTGDRTVMVPVGFQSIDSVTRRSWVVLGGGFVPYFTARRYYNNTEEFF